jgi:hypothetical protein
LFYPEQTYAGRLTLQPADLPLGDCEQASPFALPGEGLRQVAYVPTQVCFNGEIDLLEIGGSLYVVQSAGYLGAFMVTDVTDPEQPEFLGAWEWKEGTYTADAKTFRQGEHRYVVLAMEAAGFGSGPAEPCGIAIVDVTDPAKPALVDNYHGRAVGSDVGWCNVHTTEVATDAGGDGTHILVSSDDSADLRVLDVRDLPTVREVNHYRLPTIELFSDGSPHYFVHDTTITAERVYVAYWGAGLVILDKTQLLSGEPVSPLTGPLTIDPEGFEVHHAFPTEGEEFVFIEDEVNYSPPDFSQLRLWDIRDLATPREVLALRLEEPLSPPHNLLVAGDLLYVGWYNDGVRVFRYDLADPAAPVVTEVYRQPVRIERSGSGAFGVDIFDGIYGVRLHDCTVKAEPATCIYASDLTLGLLILALP